MNSLFDKILNLIFPKNCFGCGKSGTYLCEKCKVEKLKFVEHQTCFYCKKPSRMGEICRICKNDKFLDGVIIPLEYNSLIKNLIHSFKYSFKSEVGKTLSEILNQSLEGTINFDKTTKIIPVPIHKKRFLWRGFNQSEILAKYLAEFFNFEIKNDLIFRSKNTKPQVELTREERLQNVKNAFGVKKETEILTNVILIDDVVTTGATLEECAKILKKTGVKKVWGVVLAGQI